MTIFGISLKKDNNRIENYDLFALANAPVSVLTLPVSKNCPDFRLRPFKSFPLQSYASNLMFDSVNVGRFLAILKRNPIAFLLAEFWFKIHRSVQAYHGRADQSYE